MSKMEKPFNGNRMKTKIPFLLWALLLGHYAAVQGQALTFDRAIACGSGNGYYGYNGWGPKQLAIDAQGNTYVAGIFNGSIALGSFLLSATQTYTGNAIPGDVFVAKLDATGTYSWAVQLGDNQSSTLSGLAVDASGDVYLAGSFNSYSLRVGANGPLLFNSSASRDVFVAKLSGATGQALWARRAGGTSSEELRMMAANSNGEIYLLGDSRSAVADFGPHTLAAPIGSFIAKLSSSGTWLWTRSIASGLAAANSMLLDSQNNIYLAGTFSDASVNFGAITLTTQSVSGTPSNSTRGLETFVAKATDSGVWLWAVQGDAVTHQNLLYTNDLTTDGMGHLYIAGSYKSTAARVGNTVLPNLSVMGPQPNPLPPTPYTNNYYSDAFVARLNATTGAWDWAVRSGNQYNELAQRLIADGQGRVYAIGQFTNVPLGSENWQLAQLDGTTGAWRSVQSLAPLGARTFVLDGQSRLLVAGYFESATASFGLVTLAEDGPGRTTGYVARMGAGPLTSRSNAEARTLLTVWPNPAGGGAVWVQGPSSGQPVQVLDVLGRAVAQGLMPATGPLQLPLALPAGVYVVHAAGQARRLVIE